MPGSPNAPIDRGANNLPVNDSDAVERPVREQLKKTTIAGSRPHTRGEDTAMTSETSTIQRKRLHDDEGGDSTTSEPERHVRKRSKDLSGSPRTTAVDGDHATVEAPHENGVSSGNTEIPSQTGEMNTRGPATPPSGSADEEVGSALTSPKNKRPHGDAFVQGTESSKAQVDLDAPTTATEIATTEPTEADAVLDATETEPRTKRQKDITDSIEKSSQSSVPQQATAKTSSGFSNISTASPFGSLAGSKSLTGHERQTSPSAFAASGFSALAKSASPFASLNSARTTSPFAGGATKSPPPITGFGASLGDSSSKSPFASVAGNSTSFGSARPAGSGFGGLSGGFGAPLGASPFAAAGTNKSSGFGGGSGPPIVGLSNKPAKPFGTQADDEDDDDDDENDEGEGEGAMYHDEKRKDSRFYEQEHETGEEGETTVFEGRARLYQFVNESGKKKWKERGDGFVRLNKKHTEKGLTARFIMRTDKTHTIILNTPFKKELKVGNAEGGKPNSAFLAFLGTLDDKPELHPLQLKIREGSKSEEQANRLWDRVEELRKEM